MDRVLRARIVGVSFLAAAAILAAISQWAGAMALATTGIAILLLVTERDVPANLPDDAARGLVASLSRVARDLQLEGHGIVVPGEGDAASTLFIPARADAGLSVLPPVSDTTTLHRDGPSALGVATAPPGAGLEATWRTVNGLPEGRGIEEATQHIRQATAQLALGADVIVARAGDRVRIAYVPHAFAATCAAAREQDAPWHVQGGCPACSFITILAARGCAAPVRVIDAGRDGDKVTLDLEVGERSPA